MTQEQPLRSAGDMIPGANLEAYAEFGGIGIEGREGRISASRTTVGTGVIAAGTHRAWDPQQQLYYALSGGDRLQNLSIEAGQAALSGNVITKAWQTHAWRRDNSLATTQFGMDATGRIHYLTEDGKAGSYKPYKSIVIGKTLTSANLRRVRTRVKSHAKNLNKILKVFK